MVREFHTETVVRRFMQAGDETFYDEPGAQIEFIELRYELFGKILLFLFCHLLLNLYHNYNILVLVNIWIPEYSFPFVSR